MTRDPYDVLGVRRSASDAEIKTAYRMLAKRLHPDVDPNNRRIVERFKEVTAAYEFLKDPIRRRRFDRGEIDASGSMRRRAARGSMHERTRRGTNGHASARANGFSANGASNGHQGFEARTKGMNEEDRSRYQEIFSDFFGGRKGAERSQARTPGADQSYRLRIAFLEAAAGMKRRLRLAGGRRVDVRIPPGVVSGQRMRLKGLGHESETGGAPGDAILTIEVDEHPHFTRRDNDILLDLPVSLTEAVLGSRVKVPTIWGPVQVTIPPGSNTGTTLRLQGRGIRSEKQGSVSGDQYVTLKIVLPDNPPKDFVKTLRKWADKWQGDVRGALKLD